MTQTMESKNFDTAEETRRFPNGKLEIVSIGGTQMGRATFEPGWRWSQSVKPIAGTESCQVAHLGFVISGRITVAMDDGSRFELGPNDACSIPPGHDAWVDGPEPCVMLDFVGYAEYAKAR